MGVPASLGEGGTGASLVEISGFLLRETTEIILSRKNTRFRRRSNVATSGSAVFDCLVSTPQPSCSTLAHVSE